MKRLARTLLPIFMAVAIQSNSGAVLAKKNSNGNSGAIAPGKAPGKNLEFRGFSEGLAPLYGNKPEGWGFINTKAQWAIQSNKKYAAVGAFHDGLAFVQESSEWKWGAINAKGELVIPFMYTNKPADFSEGLAAVRNQENKIGYIDKTGSLVIPCNYESITDDNGLPFVGGNTIANRAGNYYSLTASGQENQKVGDATAEIRMLSNGLLTYKKWINNNTWGIGLLRTNGEIMLLPKDLIFIGDYSNGLAYAKAKINNEFYNGFINQKGDFVILQENQPF